MSQLRGTRGAGFFTLLEEVALKKAQKSSLLSPSWGASAQKSISGSFSGNVERQRWLSTSMLAFAGGDSSPSGGEFHRRSSDDVSVLGRNTMTSKIQAPRLHIFFSCRTLSTHTTIRGGERHRGSHIRGQKKKEKQPRKEQREERT